MKRILLLFFVMFIVMSAFSCQTHAQENQISNELWDKVEKLEKAGKYSEALNVVLEILKNAHDRKDNQGWTKAFIRAVVLKRTLHSPEESVKFMIEEKWLNDNESRAVLHIFYANTLFNYYMQYYWEINRREKVVSKEVLDLKKWTASDIFEEINNQYAKAFEYKDVLGNLNVQDFGQYIQRHGYPAHIRSTMLDFLVYQWAEFWGNTNTWTPKESQEKYKLKLELLLALPETREALNPGFFTSSKVHPLEKIVGLLDYLYTWHKKKERMESALESQLERLRRFDKIFTDEKTIEKIILAMDGLLKGYENYPWWAAGQYEYATLIRKKGDLVKAHALALSGAEKYPKTMGGEMCDYLCKLIEAPSLQIQAMSIDRLNVPSIKVNHKNLTSITLRAWKIDFEKWIMRPYQNYFGMANPNDLRNIVHKDHPDSEWQVSLEDPGDYGIHTTYVTPKIQDYGLYVIAASVAPEFDTSENIIPTTVMLFSPLVPLLNQKETGHEVMVMEGKTGKAVPEAEVSLYKYTYRQAPMIVGRKTTDKDGKVFFQMTHSSFGQYQHFVIVRKDKDFSFDPQAIYFYPQSRDETRMGALIYTDRSIYRPQQKLYYKVVTYKGNIKDAEYDVVPNRSLTVTLYDPNEEKVEEQTVKTNAFGTASGEFVIPKGRVLGGYRLSCQLKEYFSAYFRVEEYKRPKFEVKMEKADKEYRLNDQVEVKGKAIYYFGLPVTQGKVTYRVTRTLQVPWWYWWYYGGMSRGSYEVGSGDTNLDDKGEFTVSFKPEADNDLPSKEGVSYRFMVEATVTDEGGETRNTNAVYNIGFVSIRADLSLDRAFLRQGDDGKLEITRTDLNGIPRKGQGEFKLYSLKKPDNVILPNDIPIPIEAGKKAIAGDKIRPRWEDRMPLDKLLFTLTDDTLLSQGALEHGENGKASVSLSELAPGLYRIRYTTKDAWGSAYNSQQEFIVAGNSSIPFPLILLAQKNHLKVGEKASILVCSGIKDQPYYLEFYQSQKLLEKRVFISAETPQLIDFPIKPEHRGGFSIRAWAIYDYKLYIETQNIYVPWDNKQLSLEFGTFRDLLRSGQNETWTVNVKGPNSEIVASEVLAYMYDRSLDFFAAHTYPDIGSLYPGKYGVSWMRAALSTLYFQNILTSAWYTIPRPAVYAPDGFILYDRYPVGGPGMRMLRKGGFEESYDRAPQSLSYGASPSPTMSLAGTPEKKKAKNGDREDHVQGGDVDKREAQKGGGEKGEATQVRTQFQETAFFKPHLLTDKDGQVKIEFTVPDSVTSWNVYLHAMTKDLKFMTLQKETVTRKDLMVRPYLPRFFREGDEGLLNVVVNNATDKSLQGTVNIQVLDPQSGEDRTKDFKIESTEKIWVAEGMKGANVTFALKAPYNITEYAFKVTAKTKDFSDGELRPIPVLPGRVHLIQSKFVTLKNKDTRTLSIPDLAKAGQDPTLVHQSLIVTLDGQLFYTVLKALPYLVNYPYECVEQIQNRFISTAILTSLYDQYPGVKKMAADFSKRKTRIEPWGEDANRKMALEETPWLVQSRGGNERDDLINVLDPEIAKEHKRDSLEKLQKAQIESGAFPWWPGGPPSPFMTLYILYGFAKAQEFKVEIPMDMVQRSWRYMGDHFRDYYAQRMIKENYGYEFITFLNYVLSCYNEEAYRDAFSSKEREEMLEYSFKHWRDHCPYLKAYLSLTLNRMNRKEDAKLVLESIMDSAKTEQDQGTFWAPEDRGWLWYNDHIESHAFILRTLIEVKPEDQKHIDGLVLWLLLNKKMNQWKSTKTTAEVVYSLAYTLKLQGALAVREEAKVTIGDKTQSFIFDPDQYSGGRQQIVLTGAQIQPEKMANIKVEKDGKGYMFASMTWHYSTELMPKEARGDFLSIDRSYFIRKHKGEEFVLIPVKEGDTIEVGDQVEVQISIRAKHPMEYVHLRDPRGAGFEPDTSVSGHKWEYGIVWYEEIRDSGTNFFFENLPQGEYTFRYRIRAAMGGKFKVGPATIQSMYSPDFTAFSSGKVIEIR